jgi:hypothetical protein
MIAKEEEPIITKMPIKLLCASSCGKLRVIDQTNDLATRKPADFEITRTVR